MRGWLLLLKYLLWLFNQRKHWKWNVLGTLLPAGAWGFWAAGVEGSTCLSRCSRSWGTPSCGDSGGDRHSCGRNKTASQSENFPLKTTTYLVGSEATEPPPLISPHPRCLSAEGRTWMLRWGKTLSTTSLFSHALLEHFMTRGLCLWSEGLPFRCRGHDH